MFTRTVRQTDIPEREDIDLDKEVHADTVPVLFCAACGEIRLMRVPADAA
jgi:hypothetical protein